jgi:tRNA A37 threonylcarbamoyladenosine biosynthesis protein TsaE
VSRAIIARDDEVRVIESMLDDEVEQPRAVLIQGEPGIGKTTLFDGLLEMAGERGFRSLTCPPASRSISVRRRP